MAEMDYDAEFHRVLNESAQLLVQNRPGEAVERLLTLYEVAPEHPDVLINLSGAYILQRRWDKAVALLARAVKQIPDNAMLWINLGAAQLGRLETAGPRQQARAIQAYQMAIQIDPEAPNVHYHLGLIYKERGEFNRASAFFQRALEVNPADRDARQWLDHMAQLEREAQSQAAVESALSGDEAVDKAVDEDAPDDAISPDDAQDNGGPA